jgi:hypothetical protein
MACGRRGDREGWGGTHGAEEDFANEQLKIRGFVGKRSAMFAIYNAGLERIQGDRAVARKVERLIQDALSEAVRRWV